MATVKFRIDQEGSPGVADRSRHDLAAGKAIILTAVEPAAAGGITYEWELVDRAGTASGLLSTSGSTVTLPAQQSTPFAFLIELRVYSAGNFVGRVRRMAGARTSRTRLRLPLFSEMADPLSTLTYPRPEGSTDNAVYPNLSGGGTEAANWRGWAEFLYELVMAVETDTGLALVGGDLTGSIEDVRVTRLRGRALADMAPAAGQALVYRASGWQPETLPSPTSNATQIQSRPVSSLQPSTGQVLAWQGTVWAPTTSSTGPAALAGDVGGTTATAKVTGLQGYPIVTTPPTEGQALIYVGTSWQPKALSASSAPEAGNHPIQSWDIPSYDDGFPEDVAASDLGKVARIASNFHVLAGTGDGMQWRKILLEGDVGEGGTGGGPASRIAAYVDMAVTYDYSSGVIQEIQELNPTPAVDETDTIVLTYTGTPVGVTLWVDGLKPPADPTKHCRMTLALRGSNEIKLDNDFSGAPAGSRFFFPSGQPYTLTADKPLASFLYVPAGMENNEFGYWRHLPEGASAEPVEEGGEGGEEQVNTGDATSIQGIPVQGTLPQEGEILVYHRNYESQGPTWVPMSPPELAPEDLGSMVYGWSMVYEVDFRSSAPTQPPVGAGNMLWIEVNEDLGITVPAAVSGNGTAECVAGQGIVLSPAPGTSWSSATTDGIAVNFVHLSMLDLGVTEEADLRVFVRFAPGSLAQALPPGYRAGVHIGHASVEIDFDTGMPLLATDGAFRASQFAAQVGQPVEGPRVARLILGPDEGEASGNKEGDAVLEGDPEIYLGLAKQGTLGVLNVAGFWAEPGMPIDRPFYDKRDDYLTGYLRPAISTITNGTLVVGAHAAAPEGQDPPLSMTLTHLWVMARRPVDVPELPQPEAPEEPDTGSDPTMVTISVRIPRAYEYFSDYAARNVINNLYAYLSPGQSMGESEVLNALNANLSTQDCQIIEVEPQWPKSPESTLQVGVINVFERAFTYVDVRLLVSVPPSHFQYQSYIRQAITERYAKAGGGEVITVDDLFNSSPSMGDGATITLTPHVEDPGGPDRKLRLKSLTIEIAAQES